jgi:glycosyltransferase involved in cell wall biosynthesis
MRVLLSAYECKPHAGSEAGHGWGWATHLAARGLQVHVLTLPKQQEAIEAEVHSLALSNLSFSYVDAWPAGLKEAHGPHYLAWQFSAWRAARALHKACPFDVVHHVTYGSIHVPSQLWRLRIPVIFGPVGGGQISPYSMRQYFGTTQRKELLRTVMTRMLPYSPIHRHWIQQMAAVYAGNEETLELANKMGSRQTLLSMDTGLPETFFAESPRIFKPLNGSLRLLWTGRMLPRKAILLTLDAIARARTDLKLTILGDGYPPEVMAQFIAERGLEEKVSWSGGRVPWAEVREAYQMHDAFLFTSLRDSCGSQLLEAMALGLPVITLDHQGAHCLVPAGAGIKVPVTEREDTIDAIAAAIDRFASLPAEERDAMSACGLAVARELTWNMRAERAEAMYRLVTSTGRTLADERPPLKPI